MSQKFILPLIECLEFGVILKAALVNDEFHAFEEGGGNGGRLLAEEDVDGLWTCDAQLIRHAGRLRTTFGILAISQTVWKIGGRRN